ncbi:MAG: peptidylprolyl isomerase [Myxococcota bacterium]
MPKAVRQRHARPRRRRSRTLPTAAGRPEAAQAPRTGAHADLAAGPLSALAAALALGCVFTPPPPLPEELAEAEAEARARGGAGEDPGSELAEGPTTGAEPDPEAEVDPSIYAKGDPPQLGMTPAEMRAYATAQGDPEEGNFTLTEALQGLPAGGTLVAVFHTNAGDMKCELYETLTPGTVANFVGLARGLRPTLEPDSDAWSTKAFYDNVIFHRVIPGFMIQGGDPTGTGRGETGYVIPDEFMEELRHDRAGILSMANRGPGSGSGQFFITLGPTPHLDGKHTIFGACDDAAVDVAEHIAAKRGPGNRPTDPQVIETLEIRRE